MEVEGTRKGSGTNVKKRKENKKVKRERRGGEIKKKKNYKREKELQGE